METARLITMLRRIEMPLEQIGELLHAAPGQQAALIARYRQREAERHARRQSLARFIEHAVTSGSLDGDGQPGVSKFEVAIRTVPDTPLLTATRHTAAKDLPEVIRDNAARLFTLAQDRGVATGQLIVIYHGQVGWESDGPIEVCVPLTEDARAHRIESHHQELVTEVLAEDVQFPRILAAFHTVHLRAAQLGLTPTGPPREVYQPDAEDKMPRCHVALPIAKPTV